VGIGHVDRLASDPSREGLGLCLHARERRVDNVAVGDISNPLGVGNSRSTSR
jgi:hypothetical protein